MEWKNMADECVEGDGSGWKRFLKNHWGMAVAWGAAAALLMAGAVLVYLWFSGEAQASGLVPASLGLWSMGNVVMFILHLIFWELLLIGIPAVIGAVAGWLWWKRLPEPERKQYNFSDKPSKSSKGESAFSTLFFIAFCIKVYVDGNWNAPIGSYSLDYVVSSVVTILAWGLVIFGIPMAIGGLWWLRREISRTP
jgi:hypothetical protein